jgi:hypothetical protein
VPQPGEDGVRRFALARVAGPRPDAERMERMEEIAARDRRDNGGPPGPPGSDDR